MPPIVDSRLNTAGETKEEKLGADEKSNRLHENLPWPTGHPRSSQCEPLKEMTQYELFKYFNPYTTPYYEIHLYFTRCARRMR